MSSIWVIIGFLLYYLVKGIIWVIIDVNYFKTEYNLEELPKRGDEVLVWDGNESHLEKRVFLAYIEGAKYPVRVVSIGEEEEFESGRTFSTIGYKHFKPTKPINTELDELRKKYEELGKQIEKMEKK